MIYKSKKGYLMQNQNNKPKKHNQKSNQEQSQDQFDWKRAGKTSFIWLMIIIGAVYISGLLTESGKKLLISGNSSSSS